jgi:CRP-like cAMP-binding protein
MVRETNERLTDIMTLDAPGRLAKWLLSRSTSGDQVTIEQSQEALALYLGTTRVTVNRTLRRFVHLGLIEMHGREVVIRNRVNLAALMTDEGVPSPLARGGVRAR